MGGWMHLRGGEGIITDNTLDSLFLPGWGGAHVELVFRIYRLLSLPGACYGGTYPVPHQTGQGYNGSTTFTGLTAGSHTVVLSGIANNCTVSGGTSRTVNVPAGGTGTASFSVSCPTPPPPTGDLTVNTSTSGGTPDPDGYTVSVTGGGSQAIGINGSVTFSGLAAGSHTVTLGGIASNCTVSGGTSQTVNVPTGGTGTASFSVSCPTPPPPNRPP